ncbi:unnamed protein product [Staurois parvus]|uniref:Uncharacterized protein n=1 Tax=Staurois parvus TaxID=386267 RepID=A0ABN9DMW4_9NEOB|nr:unnamed protein product [Staurois parvus]
MGHYSSPPTDTNDGALFHPPLTPTMGHYSPPLTPTMGQYSTPH